MTKLELEWEEARCPICRMLYSYAKRGYKPPTCNNFDCLHKYLHNLEFRAKEVIEANKKD